MAGFPIVSLGSLVGSYNACEVLIPQFEIDEYYMGDEAIGKQAWSGRYPTAMSAGYIKSINVYPNNINTTTGVASVITTSQGFRNLNSYSIGEKSVNIQYARLDCFYLTKIDLGFLALRAPTTKTQIVEHTYINLPNILLIGVNFNLQLSTNMYNIYLNIPKCNSIGTYLFHQHRIVNNLYFNAPDSLTFGIDCFGSFTNYTMTINSTLNNVSSLVQKLRNSINNTGNYPSLVKFKEGKVVTDIAKTFDLRYWDLWQNTTGKDSGLH